MLTTLLILTVLIWLPILFHQIIRRGFLVLLIWLIIAPIALNVIERPGQNPFFSPPQEVSEEEANAARLAAQDELLHAPATITMEKLVEPTRVLFILFLVIFLLEASLKKKRLIPFDKVEIWMIIFSLILIASTLLQSRRLAWSLRTAFDAFIVPFITYYLFRRLVTSEDRLRQLTIFLGYISFYLIICVLAERMMHSSLFHRVSGPFETDNQLYVVIMTAFFMLLIHILSRDKQILGNKTNISSGVLWFVLCLSPLVILATWGRSNWLGLLSGIWIVMFLGYRLLKLPRKLAVIALALLLIPLIIVGVRTLTPEEVIAERAANIQTINSRIGTWKFLIQLSATHPVFGIGLNNSRILLVQQEIVYGGSKSVKSSHSVFLSILVEQGAVGLLAYLAIMISIIQTGRRLYREGSSPQDRWRGIGIIALIVAHLVPGQTTTIMHVPSVCHIYVFAAIGGIAGLYSHSQRMATASLDGSPVKSGFALRRVQQHSVNL